MKTYGTIDAFGGAYIIEAEPHVVIRLKRLFPRIARKQDKICVADTLETSRELEWFMARYPLEFKRPAVEGHLASRASQHRDGESLVDKLMRGIDKGMEFRLALPPREYQRVAGSLILSTPGIIIGDDLGIGKQHPVDTKILTPDGYRSIGELRVGDFVIGSNGKPTRVKGVFPQGIKPNYRVGFSDGSSVEAGPDHLWTVRYYIGGRRPDEIVVTTEQIRSGSSITRKHSNGVTTTLTLGKASLYVPMLTGAAQFTEAEPPPIPAYTLGQLIANGCMCATANVVSSHVKDAEFVAGRLTADGASLGSRQVYGNSHRVSLLGLHAQIRALGLNVKSAQKFIPECYQQASIADRVALLHGLMDADGSVSATGSRVTYSTFSRRLADDLVRLVECLGGMATIYEACRAGKGDEYIVRVRTPEWVEPFSLPRKLARYAPQQRRMPTRRIKSITYSRDVESVCIAVEAEDHLYATEHAIITHNTVSAICAMTDPRARPALVVTMTHLPVQWESELRKFAPRLTTHILRGTSPYDLTKFNNGKFPDVVITSYSKLPGWRDTLSAVGIKYVCFDEVQELRNGTNTEKGAAAYQIARKATFRCGLTATPTYNMGGEIHPVVEMVRPGAMGTKTEFATEWCVGDTDKPGKLKIKDPRALGTYLRDSGLMIRRTKQDVGRELPKLTRVPHQIEADMGELKRIEGKAIELAKIIMSKTAGARGESFQAAQELNNLVRKATGISKAPYVAEFVRMLVESDEKVVVYAWHRDVYSILMEELSKESRGDLKPVMYSGSESPQQKAEAKRQFCEGDAKVLIISLRSGAGLDGLQHHSRVGVFAELDWSSGVHEQCEGRVYRDGQPDPVVMYYLLSTSGSDPIISDLLGIKRAQLEGIRDPNGAFEHGLDAEGQNVRKLAQAYLAKQIGAATRARP